MSLTPRRMAPLPQNKLQTTVSDLQTQIDALKTTQYLGGSSVVFFTTSTGHAYDWTGTLTQIPGFPTGNGQAFLVVTATANTMATLYANLIVRLFVGSPTAWYRPSDGFTDQLGSAVPFSTSVLDAPNSGSDPALKTWVLQVTGDLTRTAYVQVFVQALDGVAITVTQVA